MIDFLKYRIACAVYSVLLIAAFIGAAVYKHNKYGEVFKYSIDFTGGTQVLLKFDKPVSANKLQGIVESAGWHGAVLREFSGKNEVLVRVKEFSNDAKGLGERISAAAQTALPDTKVEVLQSEGVGAGVGETLRYKSIRAIIICLIAILLYIAIRFWSFAFAAGAVVALAHDAIVMIAAFLFLDKEISINVIGAILAVLGYSINDTIVIFAQIRDNIKKMPGVSLYQVVNTSLNQTLRRTILTSLSTSLTVIAMFILGGPALRDFSLALLVGIVFGTYSSIYIASPVMMLLYREQQ